MHLLNPSVLTLSILCLVGCVTAPDRSSSQTKLASSNTVKQISVPSDSGAQYYVLDKGTLGSLRTITTKRIGPSGSSYSKRLYSCSGSTVKYLGTGDTLAEMNRSSPSGDLSPIVKGSIAYYVGLEACK